MKIDIRPAKTHTQANDKVIKGVRNSIESFFGGIQDPNLDLSVVIFSVGTGGHPDQQLRVIPTGKARPPSVSVSI